MEIKIEKGIPMPQRNQGKWINLFRNMKVGDSFECEERYRNSMSACASRIKIKVSVHQTTPGKVRVWRVK